METSATVDSKKPTRTRLCVRTMEAQRLRKLMVKQASPNRAKERALTRLFKVLQLTERLTPAQVITEAHFAFKQKLITKDQARVLGCNIR